MEEDENLLKCQAPEAINYLSHFCLTSGNKSLAECYPENLVSQTITTLAGVWCIVISIFGLGGNLLTLLAIPYAAKNKRFRLQKNWNSSTLFILHLAFADSLYCLINLPIWAYERIKRDFPFGPGLCYLQAAFTNMNAFADWMALALVALSRCLLLIKPHLWNKVCRSKFRVYLMLASAWVFAFLIISPVLFGDSQTFGWYCRSGACSIIPTGRNGTKDLYDKLQAGPNVVSAVIAFIIVLVCYLLIWWKVSKSASYIRQRQRISQGKVSTEETRLTQSILLICICYAVFVVPLTLTNLLDPNTIRTDVLHFFYCLYWTQYCINFVVYAALSKQYRKAYKFYLGTFWLLHFGGKAKVNQKRGHARVFIDRAILPFRLQEVYDNMDQYMQAYGDLRRQPSIQSKIGQPSKALFQASLVKNVSVSLFSTPGGKMHIMVGPTMGRDINDKGRQRWNSQGRLNSFVEVGMTRIQQVPEETGSKSFGEHKVILDMEMTEIMAKERISATDGQSLTGQILFSSEDDFKFSMPLPFNCLPPSSRRRASFA